MKKLGLLIPLISVSLCAKDFGTRAQTFEIREESFLEMIQKRLQKLKEPGEMKAFEDSIKKRVSNRIMRPLPVKGVSKALENQRHYYDPTVEVENDIKDHKGRMIHPKGTRINPLNTLNWGTPLLLIDGEDPDQIAWAQSQNGKITLVNGSPITLENDLRQPIYFDQEGIICRKLQIQHVPARVTQQGRLLMIEEIKVGD